MPHPPGARQSLHHMAGCPLSPGSGLSEPPCVGGEVSTALAATALPCPPVAPSEVRQASGPTFTAPASTSSAFHKLPWGVSGDQGGPLGSRSRLSVDT